MGGGKFLTAPNMENKLIARDGNKIIIDVDLANLFMQQGGEVVLNPKAEDAVIALKEAQGFLEQLMDAVKAKITDELLAINPNAKGVQGGRSSFIYRYFGSKYKFEWSKKELATPFIKEKVSYSVDSEKVDKYLKDVGELPMGILEAERTKQLVITIKEEEEESVQLLEEHEETKN